MVSIKDGWIMQLLQNNTCVTTFPTGGNLSGVRVVTAYTRHQGCRRKDSQGDPEPEGGQFSSSRELRRVYALGASASLCRSKSETIFARKSKSQGNPELDQARLQRCPEPVGDDSAWVSSSVSSFGVTSDLTCLSDRNRNSGSDLIEGC